MDNNTKLIFHRDIWPVMYKYHREHPKASSEAYFSAVVTELKKKDIALNNDLVNMILDQMAKDAMPRNAFGYIKNKVYDNNIVKTVFDWTHSNLKDTPLDLEVKRRAELMYDAGTFTKTVASVATAVTDIAATAPVAVLCPQSAVYGILTQGGYDFVNNKWLLPENEEERKATADAAIGTYNAKEEAANWQKIPGWMLSKNGITDYKNATDKQLTAARDWAKKNAKFWHDEYYTMLNGKYDYVDVNGKKMTKHQCLVKYDQYDLFRGECQRELTSRYLAKLEEEKKQREEKKTNNSLCNDDNDVVKNATDTINDAVDKGKETINEALSSFGSDPWGQLLNTLGFNGLGNVGKHLGLTLATLPDAIFGIFTGKTKSVGMNADTLIPVACLVAGRFVQNPMLKAALMGYGGLNLLNKLGNEQLARRDVTQQQPSETITSGGLKFKKYEEELLNPRITNLQIQGNRLIADIDKIPCTITLPDTAVQAYQSRALPLSTLANAVLAKNDTLKQQVSDAYELSQKQEQSRGIR